MSKDNAAKKAFRFKQLSQFVPAGSTKLKTMIREKKFPAGEPLYPGAKIKIWYEDVIADWQRKQRDTASA